jgi:hypothetical protein
VRLLPLLSLLFLMTAAASPFTVATQLRLAAVRAVLQSLCSLKVALHI